MPPRPCGEATADRTVDLLGSERELGGTTITVPLHPTDDDTARKFNRIENIRQIAPSDPDFKQIYRRPNDAESINRALDDTLWLRRAHSIGHERQHLNLITAAGWPHRRSSTPISGSITSSRLPNPPPTMANSSGTHQWGGFLPPFRPAPPS